MFIKLFIPALVGCVCNASANMFWKMRFDKVPLSIKSLNDVIGLLSSPLIWAGISCYACSMLLFFYMISNYKLSSIMPVTCMTYIFNIIIAKAVFGEPISKIQIIGIGIVILGLLVLSRSGVAK